MSAMTDTELLGYAEIHCCTERALFSAEHVNRILELAGHPKGYVHSVSGWTAVHEEYMQPLIVMARARMKIEEFGASANVPTASILYLRKAVP